MSEEQSNVGDRVRVLAERKLVDLIDSLYQYVESKRSEMYDKGRLKFGKGFETYLKETRTRCSKVKTLINRIEPVDIRAVHVQLDMLILEQTFPESRIKAIVAEGRQVVITGIAGSGKSMTLKSLYLSYLDELDSIPVFVELRHLKEFEGDLLDYICSQIGAFTGGFNKEALNSGIRNKEITLLLDGFDEISAEFRDEVERQVLAIADNAPNCCLVLSSRPNERFKAWERFTIASVCDLTLNQVEAVIAKSGYEEGSRQRFANAVAAKLYDSHRTLLANPLLCCMMLLTYEEFSEMPSKMHVFYEKAFEVLHRRHDALKQNYVRKFGSKLPEHEFGRAFESFCFFSFSDGCYSFEPNRAISYATEALEYEGLSSTDAACFLEDLIENVCILLQEGDQISFIHRTFQEYFTAKFLIGRGSGKLRELIAGIDGIDRNFTVLEFIKEMNLEIVDRYFLKDALADVIRFVETQKTNMDILELYATGVSVRDGQSVGYFRVIDMLGDNNTIRKECDCIEKYLDGKVFGTLQKTFDTLIDVLDTIPHEANDDGRREFAQLTRKNREKLEKILDSQGFRQKMLSHYKRALEDVCARESRRENLLNRRKETRQLLMAGPQLK